MSRVILARSNGVWLNEPVRWTAEADHLHILTDEATGFWRETH
jgi:regulation of enolase protein 1 (concanavalin A-like superfamily)